MITYTGEGSGGTADARQKDGSLVTSTLRWRPTGGEQISHPRVRPSVEHGSIKPSTRLNQQLLMMRGFSPYPAPTVWLGIAWVCDSWCRENYREGIAVSLVTSLASSNHWNPRMNTQHISEYSKNDMQGRFKEQEYHFRLEGILQRNSCSFSLIRCKFFSIIHPHHICKCMIFAQSAGPRS